jgi:hypothetical protein
MKKTVLIFILTSLYGFYGITQEKLWFEETFDNNKKKLVSA